MSVHWCLLQSTEPVFISTIAHVQINFSVIQLPGFSSPLSASFCVFILFFLEGGDFIFTSRSESTVEMVQNILYDQIHIWQIMSTHLICHRPKISMGELLYHTLNECGNEGSGIFRGIQREPVRNSRTQLNILSTICYTN